MSDELARRLAGVLAAARGASETSVHDLTRLSGGASRETFAFDCSTTEHPEHRERLILQRGRPGTPAGPMANEIDVLRAAARAGVKVPEIVAASVDPEPLGAPFIVMRRIEGETIARRILRDDDYDVARGRLVADCAAELAKIHELDPAAASGLAQTDQLAALRAVLDAYDEHHPTFELAFRWLDEHRPDSTGRAIVHGDFRLGNLIVDRDGLAAVLDWELTHIGDPVEDLGWMCVRAWRFGASPPVAGVGEYDELLSAYEDARGARVEPEALRWWEVLGTLRWGVICIVQYRTHRDGHVRSVELAAIGRRVCETEYDLLRLLP